MSWQFLYDDPVLKQRKYKLKLDGNRSVIRTEHYGTPELLDANAAQRALTAGEKFGDMRKVASIPMNVWAEEIAPRMRDGNAASIRKWLNDPDRAKLRTFEGQI